jgi:hypothetical protein
VIETHFDLVAVVEVMQKAGEHPGYDRLLDQLGAGWTGWVTGTPRPRTSSGNAEFYAFVWRGSLVRPCDGWTGLRYFEDHDGSPEGTGENRFEREPAYGCWVAGPDQSTVGFDFLAAAYHATWSSGNTGRIQAEVRNIAAVFEEMAAAVPGERDLFVLGDFNLVPGRLADALQFASRTDGTGSTLNTQGERTGNLYDHLVVHDVAALGELVGNAVVLDVRDVGGSPGEFYSTVSDHLPIVGVFRVGGPDDDPAP